MTSKKTIGLYSSELARCGRSTVIAYLLLPPLCSRSRLRASCSQVGGQVVEKEKNKHLLSLMSISSRSGAQRGQAEEGDAGISVVLCEAAKVWSADNILPMRIAIAALLTMLIAIL
jgi:hypothetical protein